MLAIKNMGRNNISKYSQKDKFVPRLTFRIPFLRGSDRPIFDY